MNSFLRTYDFIRDHPLGSKHLPRAMWNWFFWQIRSRLRPGPHIVPFVGSTRLGVKAGMHGATGNIYCGLHDFEDMALLIHLLRAGDLFVDVGANVGAYTVIASGYCGARTIAIEPAKAANQALVENIELNGLEGRVRLHQCAAGATNTYVWITEGLDCRNHVVSREEGIPAVRVQQRTLDDLLDGEVPVLIKLDVEGFELSVLDGASKTFGRSGLRAVIVEANGSSERYGQSDRDLFDRLERFGFSRAFYDPLTRALTAQSAGVKTASNMLYVRDISEVQRLVSSAPKLTVLGEVF